MTYVALAAVALVALTALLLQDRRSRQTIREHARERQLLINQVLHAKGLTWQPPPVAPPELDPEPEGVPMLMASPDQLPDY